MYEFQHKATVVQAHRLTRDMIIQTERGRQNARAGMWHIVGLNGKEYVIDHETFVQSYQPRGNQAKQYFEQVQEDF